MFSYFTNSMDAFYVNTIIQLSLEDKLDIQTFGVASTPMSFIVPSNAKSVLVYYAGGRWPVLVDPTSRSWSYQDSIQYNASTIVIFQLDWYLASTSPYIFTRNLPPNTSLGVNVISILQ